MNIINKMSRWIKDRNYRFFWCVSKGFYNRWTDEKYLQEMFKIYFGYDLDLINPKTFSEKLQWLKLYDRKPEYTMMVDKYKVRDYVADKIGDKYLIPLLGVWDSPDDIDFKSLPKKFVLKCNHNSGLGMCICKDKSSIDTKAVKSELKKGLKQNYYFIGREWPYKGVKRKIIAEKYMTDSENVDRFTDYKFFCFNGVADSVMVCIDREKGNPKFYFFNKNWELCRYNIRGKNAAKDFSLPCPSNIKKMFEIAEQLSQGIPFVRVDLYNSNGEIYFGELTFFPDSGFDNNLLPETDRYFGSLINLRRIKNKDEDNRISN